MNSSAIYTVIDKGRESYFLSSIAGGYSYPFYIFNYADRMARVVNENYPMGEVSVSEIFPLMKANSSGITYNCPFLISKPYIRLFP